MGNWRVSEYTFMVLIGRKLSEQFESRKTPTCIYVMSYAFLLNNRYERE